MPNQIPSLRRYQRPRRNGRFADLPLPQRAAAEAHYQRLCARWGNNLPQWRRAILVGRARDLVVRPRDAGWARALRRRRTPQPGAPALTTAAAPQPHPQRAVAAPQPGAGAPPPAHLAPSVAPVHVTPPRAPAMPASPLPPANVASPPPPAPSTLTPSSPHAVRLDIRGVTTSGTDGNDTAQRILRDLDHRAFGQSPYFSMAVPGKDLPQRWAWRLEVVPVP